MLFILDIAWTLLKIFHNIVKIGLPREIHKFFLYIAANEGKFSNRILTCLHCTKYNEINVCHLNIPDHISYLKMV